VAVVITGEAFRAHGSLVSALEAVYTAVVALALFAIEVLQAATVRCNGCEIALVRVDRTWRVNASSRVGLALFTNSGHFRAPGTPLSTVDTLILVNAEVSTWTAVLWRTSESFIVHHVIVLG
jgi:hypothetical protein